jgi:Tfp pilus assembly protein PilF
MIYELLAFRASDEPELRVRDRDEQLTEMTYFASQKFEAGDFAAARLAYRAILEVFPDDSLARFMIAECMEKEPILPMRPRKAPRITSMQI